MEQQPPPVTIVDPSLPGTADLLDSGRDPWRPSRRQKVVVVAAVVIAALVAGAVVQVRNSRREQELDRLDVAQVSLSAIQVLSALPEQGYVIELVNGGPSEVALLGVGLAVPGFTESPLRSTVGAGATTSVLVPHAGACDATLYSSPPQALSLRVRTPRGAEVTRELPLLGESLLLVDDFEREHCGLQRPQRAVFFHALYAQRRGETVVVRGQFLNESSLPLTVTSLGAVPGLQVSTRLPVRLAGRDEQGPVPSSTGVTLVLRVTDCARVRASLDTWPDQRPDLLRASVANRYESATVTPSLTLASSEVSGYISEEPMALLARLCPELGRPIAAGTGD